MTQRIQQIQRIVQQQGITRLVHFTRVDNLASIMQHGIVPIANARGVVLHQLLMTKVDGMGIGMPPVYQLHALITICFRTTC